VGIFVGDAVGRFVGNLVAGIVGDAVGIFVGISVGGIVGDPVGRYVGDTVETIVGNPVGGDGCVVVSRTGLGVFGFIVVGAFVGDPVGVFGQDTSNRELVALQCAAHLKYRVSPLAAVSSSFVNSLTKPLYSQP